MNNMIRTLIHNGQDYPVLITYRGGSPYPYHGQVNGMPDDHFYGDSVDHLMKTVGEAIDDWNATLDCDPSEIPEEKQD